MSKTIYWYKYRSEKKVKSDVQKDLFILMNIEVFGRTMENVSKYGDIKLTATERRRNYLVSEPNYHNTKFSQNIY